ncbi:MAG: hypothetical protein EBZ48_17545, partial [Proteobacteria bacterium]|nr:hypothetical protein [Pseudomonadota bacterium]
WAQHPELVRALIVKGDSEVLRNIARYVLSRPHWASHPELPIWWEALGITSTAQRRAFLQARLGGVGTAGGEAFTQLTAGAELHVGARVRTPGGRELTVISGPETGSRGRVYRVRPPGAPSDGSSDLALKVARNSEPETLASITSERAKREAWHRAGLPHAEIIEHSETGDFTLSRFIEGVRADVWLNEWVAAGMPGGNDATPEAEPPQLARLRELITRSSERGIYIGDLNPKNLIWSAGNWVVIDSGGAREGIAPSDALARYLEKIPARWARRASSNALGSVGCDDAALAGILRALLSQ